MTSVEPVTEQPVQQPPMGMEVAPVRAAQPYATDTWGSGLCGCCGDIGSCCLGCICPPILACMVSGKMGECCCAGCISLAALRTKHRIQQGIQGSVCKDSLVSCICFPCVLCQLAREMKVNHQPITYTG